MEPPGTPERSIPVAKASAHTLLMSESPVFLPASPPQQLATVLSIGDPAVSHQTEAPDGHTQARAPLHLALEFHAPPLPPSEMDLLPFELKLDILSLLAYGDLVNVRGASAELRTAADHIIAQQSSKSFCCLGCSTTICRPQEVFPMERRVGFEVCGAGTEDANGMYEPGVVPHYYGPPAWRKRGSSLFMFRWARTRWCLARLNLDEPDNGHIDDEWFLSNRLYVAPSGNPPCEEPPLRGWRPVRGASPAPASCREAYLPVLHAELPAEEVGAHLPLLRKRHTVEPTCPVSDIEFEDSDLTLCGASRIANLRKP